MNKNPNELTTDPAALMPWFNFCRCSHQNLKPKSNRKVSLRTQNPASDLSASLPPHPHTFSELKGQSSGCAFSPISAPSLLNARFLIFLLDLFLIWIKTVARCEIRSVGTIFSRFVGCFATRWQYSSSHQPRSGWDFPPNHASPVSPITLSLNLQRQTDLPTLHSSASLCLTPPPRPPLQKLDAVSAPSLG